MIRSRRQLNDSGLLPRGPDRHELKRAMRNTILENTMEGETYYMETRGQVRTFGEVYRAEDDADAILKGRRAFEGWAALFWDGFENIPDTVVCVLWKWKDAAPGGMIAVINPPVEDDGESEVPVP